MKTKTTLSLIIGIWLAFISFSYAGEPSIQATLSSNAISLDETATLTIVVEGSRSPDIELPEIDGLIFHSRGTSTMLNMVNGDFSSSATARYIIQAVAMGKYTIPPIEVVVSGKKYKTAPLGLAVTTGPNSAPPSSGIAVSSTKSKSEIAFLEISPLGKHYVGEIVPITINGYFDEKYQTSLESQPIITGDGVMMEPFTGKPSQTRVQVDGKIYTKVSWQTTITGIKEGTHPLNLSMKASVITRQARSNNPFGDPFFDSFFSGGSKKPLQVTAEPFTFSVLALPTEGQPNNFSGAIGNFSISVTAEPIIADLGEPITIRTTISGEGNYDRVHAPIFPSGNEWKSYSPSIIEQNPETNNTKIFEQVIVAKTVSIEEIPSLTLDYFDPNTKEYQQATSKPIAIHIRPSTTSSSSRTVLSVGTAKQIDTPSVKAVTTNQEQNTIVPNTNLLPQHLVPGIFTYKIEPLFKTTTFQIVIGFSLLILILAILFHLISYFRNKDPKAIETKKLKKGTDAALEKLARSAEHGESKAYLELCTTTIQQYLALQWDIEPTAITAITVREKLSKQSLFFEILERSAQASFGGAPLSKEEMNNYLIRLKEEFVA